MQHSTLNTLVEIYHRETKNGKNTSGIRQKVQQYLTDHQISTETVLKESAEAIHKHKIHLKNDPVLFSFFVMSITMLTASTFPYTIMHISSDKAIFLAICFLTAFTITTILTLHRAWKLYHPIRKLKKLEKLIRHVFTQQ